MSLAPFLVVVFVEPLDCSYYCHRKLYCKLSRCAPSHFSLTVQEGSLLTSVKQSTQPDTSPFSSTLSQTSRWVTCIAKRSSTSVCRLACASFLSLWRSQTGRRHLAGRSGSGMYIAAGLLFEHVSTYMQTRTHSKYIGQQMSSATGRQAPRLEFSLDSLH